MVASKTENKTAHCMTTKRGFISRASCFCEKYNILLTKTTAAQNEAALSYHRMCGLYFLAVVFVATIVGN